MVGNQGCPRSQAIHVHPALLEKEDLHQWESFALATPNKNNKEQPDCIWEAFEGSFRQTKL